MSWPFIAFCAFLALIALAGGSSRADSFSQIIVRLGSISFVAALILLRPGFSARGSRPALLLLAVMALLIGAHLVPLPPATWTGLPGRGLYASIDATPPWRPLNLAPDRGWNALLALIPPLSAVLGLCCLSREERERLIVPVLLVVGASAILGVAQLSGGAPAVFQRYATNAPMAAAGLFANRNHGALLLALGLPLLAYWALKGRRSDQGGGQRGAVGFGAGALLVLAIPSTGSRTGLLVGGLALLMVIALSARTVVQALAKLSRRTRMLALTGGAAAIVSLLVVALTFDQAVSVQRFVLRDIADDPRGRTLPTLRMMAEQFFPAGVGFGSFEYTYRRFQPFELLGFTYLNQAHNDLLQIVIEAGAPGAGLLIAAVAWWGWRTVVLWRVSASVPYVRLGRIASGLLLLVTIASLVDYPVRTPLFMVLLAIFASWLTLYDPRLRR
ncbi:O-antigen ligase family protein [uncultured Sphingomonas sp.]|uniref:O-antigen ligase family protein n=1 Tax=uncultured Sphingomonas sp. TaxID=158754 RepID=UPI0035CBF532